MSSFAINNSTYLGADVPSLYTALTVGDDYASNPIVYGDTNPYIFKYGEIVEIILNNQHTNLHPWHLHGHNFQVLERTVPDTGSWPGYHSNYSNTPVIRDTIMLQPNAYTVIRFKADNPGVWLWHCQCVLVVPLYLSFLADFDLASSSTFHPAYRLPLSRRLTSLSTAPPRSLKITLMFAKPIPCLLKEMLQEILSIFSM